MTNILAWDLESSPMLSWHWGRWSQDIAPVQTVQESRVLCFGAKWIEHEDKTRRGKYITRTVYDDGVRDMLTTINDLLTEADGVLSWNGASFDSPKIRTEFLLEGMAPPAPYKEIDLMRVAKSQFKFSSNKLDAVAEQLGVGRKLPHEGFALWLKVMDGDEAARRKFARYQKQDVLLLEHIYDVFKPWIPNRLHPNRALIEGKAFACPICGSTDVIRRGFDHTQAGRFQRFQCLSCHKWSRTAHRETTTELRGMDA